MAPSPNPSPPVSAGSTSSQRPSSHLRTIAMMPVLDVARIDTLIRQLNHHITDITELSGKVPNALKEGRDALDALNRTSSSDKAPKSPSSSEASDNSGSGARAGRQCQTHMNRVERMRRQINTTLGDLRRNESGLQKSMELIKESLDHYASNFKPEQLHEKEANDIRSAVGRAGNKELTQNVQAALDKCGEEILRMEDVSKDLEAAHQSRKENTANTKEVPPSPPASEIDESDREETDESTDKEFLNDLKKKRPPKPKTAKAEHRDQRR